MKLGIDISRYQSGLTNIQWDLFKTILDFVIIRSSFGNTADPFCANHIAQCKRVGLPFAFYHWGDPTTPMLLQVNKIKELVYLYNPKAVFLDAEQYWTDWPAYMRQDLVSCYNTRMGPAQLNDFYKKFYETMLTTITLPIGNYSADWFINSYSPQMATWIYTPLYWEALYLRYTDPAWLSNFYRVNGNPIPLNKIRDVASYAGSYINKHTAEIRQFDSKIPTQGLPANLDYNVIAKDTDYVKIFGIYVPPTPPIDPPPVVENKYLIIAQCYVRSTPNMGNNIIGYRWKSTIVNVKEIQNEWYNVDEIPNAPGGKAGWIYKTCLVKV